MLAFGSKGPKQMVSKKEGKEGTRTKLNVNGRRSALRNCWDSGKKGGQNAKDGSDGEEHARTQRKWDHCWRREDTVLREWFKSNKGERGRKS